MYLPVCIASSLNTVQLVRLDGSGRVVGRLGPGGVGGALDVPLGVLPFHDAGR